jgi:polynucleotide 5'-hydroxyl-kinase GRC3/NOL9
MLSDSTTKRGTATAPSSIAILGVSNTDSSSFARWMVNSYLAKNQKSVVFLDLNPDNPVVGLPGHFSLSNISSPLLHPQWAVNNVQRQLHQDDTVTSYATGKWNPRNASIYYEYAKNLLHEGLELLDTMVHNSILVYLPPWLQGGLGMTVMKLLEALEVKDVIVVGAAPNEHLASYLSRKKLNVVAIPNTAEPQLSTRNFTASQRRNLSLQTYFHSIHHGSARWNPAPLSTWRPHVVSYAKSDLYGSTWQGGIDFNCLVVPNDLPPMYPNMLSSLFNGTIVSIMVMGRTSELPDLTIKRGAGDDIPYHEGLYLHGNGDKVVGMALIRAMDVENQLLHLIAPDWLASLNKEQIMLTADVVDTPAWAYAEDFHYFQWAKRNTDSATGELLADTKGSGGSPWIEVNDG